MISGVLLAAGASSRFGSPKMLFPVGGVPLLARVARAFLEAGASDLVAVLGSDADAVRGALAGLPVRVAVNERWEDGMFTSVKAGLRTTAADAARIAVSPADLPGLTAAAIRRVLESAEGTGETTLLVPTHAGRRGHPLVFSPSVRARLLEWPDDSRLSDLLLQPDLDILHLEGFDAGVVRDLDLPPDASPEAV